MRRLRRGGLHDELPKTTDAAHSRMRDDPIECSPRANVFNRGRVVTRGPCSLASFTLRDDQFLRVGVRQRPQQCRVNHAEERRGDADAQRERQAGDDRKGGLAAQLA